MKDEEQSNKIKIITIVKYSVGKSTLLSKYVHSKD